MYTDVQQLKMVQMVSRSQFFRYIFKRRMIDGKEVSSYNKAIGDSDGRLYFL